MKSKKNAFPGHPPYRPLARRDGYVLTPHMTEQNLKFPASQIEAEVLSALCRRARRTYEKAVLLSIYLERRWVRANFRSWIKHGYY